MNITISDNFQTITRTQSPKVSCHSKVPKADRISYYKILMEVKQKIGEGEKIKWVRVGCDWRCLYAEGKICLCSCHGENHQSEGVKAIAENIVWNWPDILRDYIENFQKEGWTGKFKMKINWQALLGDSMYQLDRKMDLRGATYQEKLQNLMEVASVEESQLTHFREYIEGTIRPHYRKTSRVLSESEKVVRLLSLGLEPQENPKSLEESDTLEENFKIVV